MKIENLCYNLMQQLNILFRVVEFSAWTASARHGENVRLALAVWRLRSHGGDRIGVKARLMSERQAATHLLCSGFGYPEHRTKRRVIG